MVMSLPFKGPGDIKSKLTTAFKAFHAPVHPTVLAPTLKPFTTPKMCSFPGLTLYPQLV